MRRKLFTVLSALSLLPFSATVTLWVTDSFTPVRLIRVGPSDWVLNYNGIQYLHASEAATHHLAWRGWIWEFHGLAYTRDPREQIALWIKCSFSMLALATALPPAAWLIGWLAARRRALRNGHCLACGYDLRATPDRCPECGTPAPAGGVRTEAT